MNLSGEENLRSQLSSLQQEGVSFFEKTRQAGEVDAGSGLVHFTPPDYYWSRISQALRAEALKIIADLSPLAKSIAVGCKNSLLMSDADLRDLAVEVKSMKAALRLRSYYHSDPEGIYDRGDKVLGFMPESQEERSPLRPDEAVRVWRKSSEAIGRILEMVDDQAYNLAESADLGASPIRRYRPNSAFIMMWMDPSLPELIDVRDAVSETFSRFGIKALRADEIEHDGVITQRLLDEIRSSEFLFADLTGARPNVYYEVGYAHALGKRVILFRKKGTGLHFDLAGYNCPEYDNLRDLKEKLTKRIESITNKQLESSGERT
jgi:hypothetical protein